MRRFFWIVVLFIAFVAVAWSGGWYALASWVEGKVPGVLAEIERSGIEVDCPGRDVVGFPFAVQVACGPTAVAEPQSGSAAELGGVTGGVSVFAPMTASVALESPARIESPFLPGGAEFQWIEAALALGLGVNGPQTAHFEAAGLAADVSGSHIDAARASGTLQPAPDGGTSGSAAFTDLVFSRAGTTLPPLDGTVTGWISVPPRALAAGRAGLQTPLSVRLDDTSLVTGSSRMEVEGAVTVDGEGIIDGTVTVRIAGTDGFQAFIAALPAQYQERGNQAIGGLFLLGAPIAMNGEPASELTVNIVRGQVKVGPVEVTLPRVPL